MCIVSWRFASQKRNSCIATDNVGESWEAVGLTPYKGRACTLTCFCAFVHCKVACWVARVPLVPAVLPRAFVAMCALTGGQPVQILLQK
jgi:hypothetical protein